MIPYPRSCLEATTLPRIGERHGLIAAARRAMVPGGAVSSIRRSMALSRGLSVADRCSIVRGLMIGAVTAGRARMNIADDTSVEWVWSHAPPSGSKGLPEISDARACRVVLSAGHRHVLSLILGAPRKQSTIAKR